MGPDRPKRLRLSRLGVLVVLAWLALMLAGGTLLASSQASSRRATAGRLAARTSYAATFISSYVQDVLTRERLAAENWLAGRRLDRNTFQRTSSGLGLRGAVLLDGRGRAIATTAAAESTDTLLIQRYRGLAVAGPAGASSISLIDIANTPSITFAVRYPTASGPRVLAGGYPVAGTVIPIVLNQVVTTRGWQASLVDSAGARLAAGQPGPRPADAASFSAAVPGAPWRILVNDPRSQLYGFLNGPGRWMSWLALSGLTVAGVAIIVLIAGLTRQRTRLTALNGELGRLAAVDPLTGLRNRRAIEEFLHDALSAARRREHPLSLLLVDVDHFKTFNDRLGHRSGDEVLAHIARALDGALRAEDAIGRWGGEEFLIVLPATDEEGALAATERLRAALAADQPPVAVEHGLPVTVTLGVAEWRQEDVSELITRADEALYRGKAAGRDVAKVSTVMAAVTEGPGRI